MRPLVRTRRQARQRIQSAFNALSDVFRAASRDPEHKIVPERAITPLVMSRDRARATLREYDRKNGNHGDTADEGT